MDEASKLLEKLTTPQQKLPTGYRKISPNPPLVDEMIYPTPSSINLTLPWRQFHESFSNQPLVVLVLTIS